MTTTIPRPGFRRPGPAPTLAPVVTTDAPGTPEPSVLPAPRPLIRGSVTAKALHRVWRGGELTIVDSPPGAGKTELVATVVAHLAIRAGMRIAIGTPTRAQGVALVHRLMEQIPGDQLACEIKGTELITGHRNIAGKTPAVSVTTLARMKFVDYSDRDLLVVDEAYQATYAQLSAAARNIPQVLLVGDPGQIGPVVTIDTSIWSGQKDAPHLRAPEVTTGYSDMERFALDVTWRLGPNSAAAIAPLYPFSFHSAGSHRQCITSTGVALGEIEAIEVPRASVADDVSTLAVIADRVDLCVGGALVTESGISTVTPHDVAVVCSRNSQVSILTGMLRQRGLSDVRIGTADRLQGGQWPVVIALDPFVGCSEDSEHNTSVGRLCVMASRHTTHLSWIHDGGWVEMTAGKDAISKKNRAVRHLLTTAPAITPTTTAASTAT